MKALLASLAILAVIGCRTAPPDKTDTESLTDTVDAMSPEQLAEARAVVERLAEKTPLPSPVAPDPASPVAAGRYFVLMPQVSRALDGDLYGLSLGNTGLVWRDVERTRTPAELIAALEDLGPWFAAVREAAGMRTGDLRLSAGPRSLRPPRGDPRDGLGMNMLRTRRILQAEALRLWSLGRKREAIACHAAILGMSAHQCEPPAGMVQHITAASTLYTVATDLRPLIRTESDRALVREQLGPVLLRFNSDDPSGLRAAWERDTAWMFRFAEEQLAGDEPGFPLLYDLFEASMAMEFMKNLFAAAQDPSNTGTASMGDRAAALTKETIIRQMIDAESMPNHKKLRAALAHARKVHADSRRNWDTGLGVGDQSGYEDSTGLILITVGVTEQIHKQWREARASYATLKELTTPRGKPE